MSATENSSMRTVYVVTLCSLSSSAIDILAAKDLRHVWQHHRMCVPIDFHGVPFCVLGRQECQFGKERCHEAKQVGVVGGYNMKIILLVCLYMFVCHTLLRVYLPIPQSNKAVFT